MNPSIINAIPTCKDKRQQKSQTTCTYVHVYTCTYTCTLYNVHVRSIICMYRHTCTYYPLRSIFHRTEVCHDSAGKGIQIYMNTYYV